MTEKEKTTLQVQNFRGTAEGATDLLNAIISTIEQSEKSSRVQLKVTVKWL